MNRQTLQSSHNSSAQLFYSQYLKQQQTSPVNERFSRDDIDILKRKIDQLSSQIQQKEQFISEMRQYQQILINKLNDYENMHKENILLKEQNQRLQQELKEQKRFTQAIIELVVQCHPKNYWPNRPDLKDCWRWLKRILQEYIHLKA
ncbi:hypothetical protein pb186bvf_012618 [Paramecium bursaria]